MLALHKNILIMTYIIITSVILLFILFRVFKTLNKIKALRRRGINITNKNSYYRFLSNIFLQNLPS